MDHNAPTAVIEAAHRAHALPFHDTTDFENADRGFIAALSPCIIKAADGRVVWDNDGYAFLTGDAPTSVHPSLWRQSQLCAKQGLYEVVEGIYQVRGLDLSNISFIEGDTGVIVIDPLVSTEVAAAALALYRTHRGGDRPVVAVIYTHSHVDHFGGVLGVTKGLFGEFGEARVIDTPITESAIMGAAAGAAVTGLRPVAELMFSDFFGVCFDQIYNQAAKFRYMFGGKAKTPLVIRTMIGAGRSAAAQHSQSPYHIFTSVPGLKCVVPSNAYDAKGLLIQAIRDDDPVIFCEHKLMYDLRAEVPDEPYTIPFGEANIVRDGDDVTVVALSRMVHYAGEAIDTLAKEGIECELIDPRTTSPLDEDTILESVERTGRLVVVDEATPRCGMAADIAALVADKAFASLKAPVKRVTAPHTPVPFAPSLEKLYIPNPERIAEAVREVHGYAR